MTNSFKKQRKQSPLAALALLSVLLGAQVSAFAFVDPGGGDGMPPSYGYGYTSGQAALLAMGPLTNPSLRLAAKAFITGRCTGHYSKSADVNECIYGGEVGAGIDGF